MSVYDELAACEATLNKISAELPKQEQKELIDIADEIADFAENLALHIRDRIYHDGFRCRECHHHKTFIERHPYGEGYATEELRECSASEHECPGVTEILGS